MTRLCSCKCVLQLPFHANHSFFFFFFFFFTVSGVSVIPLKNLLEEKHGGKAECFIHTVIRVHKK